MLRSLGCALVGVAFCLCAAGQNGQIVSMPRLVYATYSGPARTSYIQGSAVDSQGYVYLVGTDVDPGPYPLLSVSSQAQPIRHGCGMVRLPAGPASRSRSAGRLWEYLRRQRDADGIGGHEHGYEAKPGRSANFLLDANRRGCGDQYRRGLCGGGVYSGSCRPDAANDRRGLYDVWRTGLCGETERRGLATVCDICGRAGWGRGPCRGQQRTGVDRRRDAMRPAGRNHLSVRKPRP